MGQQIAWAPKGILYMSEYGDTREESAQAESDIRAAVVNSLAALHENKFVHSDVALRNLHVKNEMDPKTNSLHWSAC